MGVSSSTVSINDVAARANVSKGVVSVVLSGKQSSIRVSEAMRERVLKVAEELRYRPNVLARGLSERKSYLLAFICGTHANIGISTRMVQSIQQACADAGYSLVIYPASTLEMEREHLEAARERLVDGIIISPLVLGKASNRRHIEEITKDNVPFVQIGSHCDGITGIIRDGETISRQATEKLILDGRKNILFFTYPNYKDPVAGPMSWLEYCGYKTAIEQAGLPQAVHFVNVRGQQECSAAAYKSSSIEYYLEQCVRHFAKRDFPDGCVASSNSLAYAIGISALQRGLNIPENLSIISCSDDYLLPEFVFPSLAVFPTDATEIGRLAVHFCLHPEKDANLHFISQSFQNAKSFQSITSP